MSHGVSVRAEARYLESESDPAGHRYVFAYVVRISNAGTGNVQLRARHWIITDSDGGIKEVRGDGVVGEQPVIAPGYSYEYSSGCVLTAAVGTMHGRYFMVDAEGNAFEVEIPSFTLTIPRVLH
jgi:ApaG protein